MRRKLLVYLILFLFLLPFCNKKKETTNSFNKTTIKKKEKIIVKKILILKLDNNNFYNTDFLEYLKRNMGNSYKQLPESLIDKLFDNFLNELYAYIYAKEQGIEVSPKEIQYYLKKIKIKKNNNEQLKPYIMRRLIIEKYISQILSSIKISDQEIRSYYYKNLSFFRRPAEIRLSQIVVKDEKEALDIRAQLEKNKTLFPKLAEKKSVGPESKVGGDMGYFSKGQLPGDIENVVFSLNMGEISQVVKSPYGYHIFMVTKKKRKRLMALQYVFDMIKLKIKQTKFENKWNDIIKEAKKAIPIIIYNESLNKIKKNILMDSGKDIPASSYKENNS